eukprot:9100910-Prorocentrum_lima.AAC.1
MASSWDTSLTPRPTSYGCPTRRRAAGVSSSASTCSSTRRGATGPRRLRSGSRRPPLRRPTSFPPTC